MATTSVGRVPIASELPVERSASDDDVRRLVSGIGLGAHRGTVRTGFARRVLLFEHGVVERRARSIRIAFDRLQAAVVRCPPDRLGRGRLRS